MTTVRPARVVLPPWVLPIGGLVALLAALAAVVWLSGQVGTDDAPPSPGAFAPPTSTMDVTVYTVKQVEDGTLVLVAEKKEGQPQADERRLALAADVPVETLVAIQPGAIKPGDVLNAVAIPNEVRNFSIHSLVAFTPGGDTRVDGIILSPAGFAGHEVAHDTRDRPVLSGTVQTVEDSSVTLGTAGGEVTLELTAAAPLYRLTPTRAAEIRAGDRLGLAGAGEAMPRAVLVLPAP